jgi:hypothetical protein
MAELTNEGKEAALAQVLWLAVHMAEKERNYLKSKLS